MPPDVPGSIDPDRILDRTFATVRRGVDPSEVESYLRQIAGEMRAMAARIGELERSLAMAESAASVAPIDLVDPTDLTRIVGEETARVLDAARAAAADIRTRAEESVERMVRDAREEAERVRADAETTAAQRTEEAESLVARRTAEAEAAATEVRNRLEIDLARAEADGIAIIDDAKRRGREMLAEAQDVRQRMLDDLSRRRQGLRDQIEQLQASRDRLLAAFDSVRATVAVATDEVKAALPDGRIAADQAALRAVEAELAETVASMTEPEGRSADAQPVAAATVTEIHAPSPEPEAPPADPPRLSVVPPPSEPEETATTTVESVRVIRSAETAPATAAVLEPEPVVEPTPEPTSEPSPQPARATTLRSVTEGRTSSSVRVVRSGKAADVFARLREEGEVEKAGKRPRRAASTSDDATAEAPTTAEVEPAVGEVVDDQAFIELRDGAIASIAASLDRRIKRALSDEQNELLASVGTIKAKQSAVTLLPEPEAQIERYEDLALPALADAAAAGASLVPNRGKATHTSVGDLASELASSIVIPLRERIESAMSEAAGDRDDLSRLIRATYREWKGSRVDDVVDFAVRSACNRGMLDGLGRGTKIRWVVAEGDDPSPDCEDNALAGAVASGKPFPTGHIVPPLHPGCHCAVMRVDG